MTLNHHHYAPKIQTEGQLYLQRLFYPVCGFRKGGRTSRFRAKHKTLTRMKMHPDDFRRALEIITSNNRITVSFNTPVKDNYSNTHPILIHESNATVLKQLQQEGYSLSMTKKGLRVDKY